MHYSERDSLVDPTLFGLDLAKKYNTTGLVYGIKKKATVQEIIAYLERTFCGTIALEVAHVQVRMMSLNIIDHVICMIGHVM